MIYYEISSVIEKVLECFKGIFECIEIILHKPCFGHNTNVQFFLKARAT